MPVTRCLHLRRLLEQPVVQLDAVRGCKACQGEVVTQGDGAANTPIPDAGTCSQVERNGKLDASSHSANEIRDGGSEIGHGQILSHHVTLVKAACVTMNSIEESAILPVMSRREPSPGGYTKRVPLKAAACEVVPINSPDWSDFPEASPLAIGRRLWRLRKSEGKSIEAMAGKFGIGRSRWNNWEIGLDRRPETPVAYKIAKYFKVTLEWILFGDDDGIPRRILDDLPQYPNESDDDNSERTLSRP